MTKNGVPLIVDVDGTLLRSDLLWEGLIFLLTRRPMRLAGAALALLKGRAAFKAYVASESEIGINDLPTDPVALELIEEAKTDGSLVVLASAAHDSQVQVLKERVGADLGWGSDGVNNLVGSRKLSRVRGEFAEFDYVGNSRADLPLWREARRAVALNAGPLTLLRAKRARPDLVIYEGRAPRLRSWLRALRPHHWAKNGLIFLPALAAQLSPGVPLGIRLLTGFAAFSAMASSVYLFNDLADLASDRAHPIKHRRPLAAGEIAIPLALFAGVLLVAASVSLAWFLSPTFTVVLGVYFVITAAYSMALKQRVVVDVITLATLYTVRIVAGAVLVEVPLSRWFLAFSIFLFLSLALVKRVAELRGVEARNADGAAGRGYRGEDLQVLTAMGTAAAAASALVYCLYITGDDVGRLYANPDILWAGLPLFLYWITRVWVLAGRGTLQEDPVAFALRDRNTYVVLGAFLLAIWLAA